MKHQDRYQQEKLLQLASQFSQLSPQPRIRVWWWPPEADFIQLRCILSDTGAHYRFFRAWVPIAFLNVPTETDSWIETLCCLVWKHDSVDQFFWESPEKLTGNKIMFQNPKDGSILNLSYWASVFILAALEGNPPEAAFSKGPIVWTQTPSSSLWQTLQAFEHDIPQNRMTEFQKASGRWVAYAEHYHPWKASAAICRELANNTATIDVYAPTKEDIEIAEKLFPGRGKNPPWDKIYTELVGYGVNATVLRSMPCYEILKLLNNLRQTEAN